MSVVGHKSVHRVHIIHLVDQLLLPAMIQSRNTNFQAGVAMSKPRGHEVVDSLDNPPFLFDFVQPHGHD